MALELFIEDRPKKPEGPNGDAHYYIEQDGRLYVAVVDGLGSGQPARTASGRAVEVIQKNLQLPLPRIVELCHKALHDTRGAALGLACLDAAAGQGRFAGVGNIEMRLYGRRREYWMGQPGIVGTGVLPPLREELFDYRAGDLVMMYSDGLDPGFDVDTSLALESLGRHLVANFGNRPDDLTLLLLRQTA